MKALLVVLALLAPFHALSAQIFPDLERGEIERENERRKKGDPGPRPDVKPENPPPVKSLDGAALYKRYRELCDGLRSSSGRAAEMREVEKSLKGVNPIAADYMRGVALYRMGLYEDASRQFAKVPQDPKGTFTDKTLELVMGIRGGQLYFDRMMCEVNEQYTLFADQAAFDKAWDKAEKAGQRFIKDLETAVERKRVDETLGRYRAGLMREWLGAQKQAWSELWQAERAVQENPSDLAGWQALGRMTRADAQRSSTPRLLDQRAGLLALREALATDKLVREGDVDVAIATNLGQSLQFDRALAHCDSEEGLDNPGKEKLRAAKKTLDTVIYAFKRDYK